MEYSVYYPSTSGHVNLRKRKQSSLRKVESTADVSEEVDVVTTVEQVPAAHSINRRSAQTCQRQQNPHSYISEVARKYAEKMRKSKERSIQPDRENESTSLSMIKKRLRHLIGECDIERISCCIPMCGRVFNSIQVLAWHMSYSHHDLALKSAYGNLCFVCGIRMDNAKGKTIHLNSKHKELSLSHNEQCLYQRQPVISPLAPAAMRMMQVADDEEPEEGVCEEVLYSDYDESSDIVEMVASDNVPYQMHS